MTRTAPAPTSTTDEGRPTAQDQAVVVVGPSVPDWLRGWCRDTGRALEARPDIVVSSVAPPVLGPPSDDALAGRTVWFARELPERAPGRIVAAIRRLPEDIRVLREAVSAADYLGAGLLIAHAVPLSFAERSVGLDAAVADGHQLLVSAAESATARLPEERVEHVLVRCHPHELVGETLNADLLVIGGPRADRWSVPGAVRRSALCHAPCPVLLVDRHRRH